MVKTVSIKDKKESDIIKHLSDNGYLDNFSYYVKDLIRKDMQGNKNTEIKTESKKRNTNFDF